MPERSLRPAAVAAFVFCLSQPITAAEAVIGMSLSQLVDNVEDTLSARQITVVDNAGTDRFALLYAHTADGGHVSISIRQLADPDRARVTVTSDSPANPTLDQSLLQALRSAP